MQIVVDDGSERSELEVEVHDPSITVADVEDAVSRFVGTAVVPEGDILQGAVFRPMGCLEPDALVPRSTSSGLTLAVVGGLPAGPGWPLPIGDTTIGRHPRNDVVLDSRTVSGRHCSITVLEHGSPVVTDLGSYDGTWVDAEKIAGPRQLKPGAIIRLGAVELALISVDPHTEMVSALCGGPSDAIGRFGSIPFNRPPRPAKPAPPAALPSPVPPPSSPPAPPLSLVTLLTPLGFAVLMVLVLGRLVFALFALLGPVMALGTWLEARRRAHVTARRHRREHAASTRQFEADLRRRGRHELSRRRAMSPDPAELFHWAVAPAPYMWQRRAHHEDFLCLRLGTGELDWGTTDVKDPLVLSPCPVAVRLRPHPGGTVGQEASVVGLVGHRSAALAVARSLVCQAATQAGPADLLVGVFTTPEAVPEWDWAKWLPHVRCVGSEGSEGARLLSGAPETSHLLLANLLDVRDRPMTMVVLDDERLTSGRPNPARQLLRAESGPTVAVVLATTEQRLPAECDTVVELKGAAGWAVVRRGEKPDRFLATGVGEPVARNWARLLSRYQDTDMTHGPDPSTCNLVSLLPFDPRDPEAVQLAWKEDDASALAPIIPLGVSGGDVVRLDLAATSSTILGPQPHGSDAGALVQSVVLAAGSTRAPDRLHILLLDSGDGEHAAELAALPHMVGVAGPDRFDRALSELDAELSRRQSLDGRSHLHHLLVVIQEIGGLAVLPGGLDRIARICERGAAFGVHVVMTADRPEDLPEHLLAAVPVTEVPQLTSVVTGRAPVQRSLEIAPFTFGPGPRITDRTTPLRERLLSRDRVDLLEIVGAIETAVSSSGAARPSPLWREDAPSTGTTPAVGLFDLLGLTNPDEPGARSAIWACPPEADRLRVPVGLTPYGEPLVVDLKESAQGGMGPHGLIVGATGSGKSELVRTLVTALAVTHSPELLSFVFVDFKGGATFADLADLPHVAGMITNLEDDPALVDRMHDALCGEQRRRQEMLRRAGNLPSVRDYQKRRTEEADLDPLPSLLVVVDEFAELSTVRPDFIDLFVSIGRLGRSLGMHLLLTSQRLDEARLRGLESHLSYRIALRTFNASDSRAVLGVPDAYHLPPEPGSAYLQVATGELRRFRAAMVAGPSTPSELDGLRHAGRPVHQVWLPPLGQLSTLDSLLPVSNVERGAPLAVPVGMVDRPMEQAQDPLVLELEGDQGNVAVVGAPQTGKSTLLKTIVTALCLTHTPEEVNLYLIDFGGGRFLALEGAPHVGGVATRAQPEKARRLVREIQSVVAAREGLLAHPPLPHVFLVIDDWPAFRLLFEDLEPLVVDVAARGLGVGVHVAVSSNRWLDLRANLKDSFGTRLELRLNDPADSAVDRLQAANLRAGTPGRGLTSGGLQFHAALPRTRTESTEDLVRRVRSAWPGPPAPSVRVLPELVTFSELPAPGGDSQPGVPIGLGESDLEPVYLDLSGGDPHFLVLGDPESGKTTFLKSFLAGLAARNTPATATVLIIDYRRTLLEAVDPGHLFGYAGAPPAAAAAVSRLQQLLVARLPGSDVCTSRLRDRSWWSGPEVYVVVDDYDMVAAASGNPLSPLVDLLAHGRDIGLHLVLARRVAGCSRAAFEPILQRTKELGGPGLLLSGDRHEGPLIGPHRAVAQSPGRGLLVQRKRSPILVQIAWAPD